MKTKILQPPYVDCRSRVKGVGWYSPGASSALMQIVPYSSSLSTVFHSVIYNSVVLPVCDYLLKSLTGWKNYFSIWLFASRRINLERNGYNGSIIPVEKLYMWRRHSSLNLQYDGCRSGWMQDRSDAGQDSCWTVNSMNAEQGGCRTGRMQYRTDAGQIICRTGRMQDRSDAEQDSWRTGRMQDRTADGQDGRRTGQLLDRTDASRIDAVQ